MDRQPTLRLSAELVSLCERHEPDPGPPSWQTVFTDGDYDRLATRLLDEWGDRPIWVFGYGSLLWKPAFETVETRRGTAHGWRRAFCLEMRRWRGSPGQPGLMLGLQPGGSCEGMIYRLPHGDRLAQFTRLLRREVDSAEDAAAIRTIEVATDEGSVTAFVFWANAVESPLFVEHDIRTEARMLARACGHIGSGAAYLHKTVTALDGLGIVDSYLWELQHHVADEIMALAKP